jgi:hypothetical protein
MEPDIAPFGVSVEGHLEIAGGEFPVRARAVAGSEGSMLEMVDIRPQFFDALPGDMQIPVGEKEPALAQRTRARFDVEPHFLAGDETRGLAQADISQRPGLSGCIIQPDLISGQRDVAAGDAHIS